jgi:hypothetical protein
MTFRANRIQATSAFVKNTLRVMLAATTLAGFGLMTARAAGAQDRLGPQIVYDVYHDSSLPVSQYTDQVPLISHGLQVKPLYSRLLPGAEIDQPDSAEQLFTPSELSASILKNFDGMADSANGSVGAFVPSDSNLAVGATQVVEVINTAYQVFNKSGTSVQSARQISSVFTGVSGFCGMGSAGTYTDPIVLYDKAAGRWLISIVASDASFLTGNECVAISTTSNATGSYHRYVFAFGTDVFNDYPKLGVWPDAYYGSYNLFSPTAFIAAKACAYNRSAMLAGTTAKAICFSNKNEFSFLPSDLDGTTAPPAGEPNFFVDLFSTTALHLFKFHVNFTTPSKSTFTGPTTIAVTAFTEACGGFTSLACIPQAGTSDRLDSLGDRLMFRLAYRNFGTHESLVINHAAKTSMAASGVRWYEIRSPNTTPTVFQHGTLTSGSTSLWMGSIAMDKLGDMALGFSESGSSIHPKIAFTGRVPTDPAGTMEGITIIFAGKGSQTGDITNGGDRWGDYTDMVVDPSDDCTFWYVDQYIPANGDFNFNTRIASLKFSTCS